MILLSITLVMAVIKVSSLRAARFLTIKYRDDNFVLRLGVRSNMTEGWGWKQSLAGCWIPSVERRNTWVNIGARDPVVSNFPTTYVHMEWSFQCDCECLKTSEVPFTVPPTSAIVTWSISP